VGAQAARPRAGGTPRPMELRPHRILVVGDVAHELRTPLTALGGCLEGLGDGVIRSSAQTGCSCEVRLARHVGQLPNVEHVRRRR
jgi:signal transduction histidine kinase